MDYNQLYEKLKDLNATVLAALIAAGAALLVGIINSRISYLNYKNQKSALSIQQNTFNLQSNIKSNDKLSANIKALEKQLEEFYKPFNSYLTQSYLLYRNFRNNLPTGFRTLIYLVDNDYLFEDHDGMKKKVTLPANQFEMLKEIFATEDKLKDLIVSKGSIIKDSSLLMKYAPNAAVTDVLLDFDPNKPENLPNNIGLLDLFLVHCTLIKFASNKLLDKSNIDVYKRFVYPRELNGKIVENIGSLSSELERYKSQLV